MPKLIDKDDYFVSREVLEKMLDVSRSTVLRMVDRGELPAPVKISGKTTRWRVSDIKKWIKDCKPQKKGK